VDICVDVHLSFTILCVCCTCLVSFFVKKGNEKIVNRIVLGCTIQYTVSQDN